MPAFDPATEFFLNGDFAPTQSELDGAPVQVIAGALPADLEGAYGSVSQRVDAVRDAR